MVTLQCVAGYVRTVGTFMTEILTVSEHFGKSGFIEYYFVIAGGGLYFEQQKRGFICPQCSAPRKRYAKKVGDKWGVTRDGGDLPIYAFTFLGLAATAWFALVYAPTL